MDRCCCAPDDNCAGERLFNCDKAGFYGTYLFPSAACGGTNRISEDGACFEVTYTMSTWDRYNVALFTARFEQP